ncbi:MAG TPA: hypothetical protein VK956_17325, partial [Verrucomicrobium sp.]|nr:hypothetical protein [Verrucomicrobium sp.]
MIFLATAAPSDAIDPVWWEVAASCFIFGAGASLLALVASFFCGFQLPARGPRRLAGLAILATLYPICFYTYIYHIDY